MKQKKKGIVKMAANAKKEKELEVIKPQTTALADPSQGAWGAEAIDSSDLMIPKILVMQGLSDAVSEGKAQMGQIVNSVTYEVLGDKNKPVEIIPLKLFKTWVVSKKEKGKDKYEYEATIPMDASNSHLEWDEQLPDGSALRRDQTLSFYVLVASEVASGMAMPYVVSFRRTSYTAGKKLATHFALMQRMKAPPAAKSVKLTCKLEKNDLGAFYVFDIEPGRQTTPDELKVAYEWYQTIGQGQHKVDESDLRAEKEVASEASTGPDQY